MIEIRRILCPTDFSRYARLALDHALALAEWYDAELELVRVVPPAPAVWAMPPDVNPVALETAVRTRVKEELEELARDARRGGRSVRTEVLAGAEAAEILRRSRQWPADIVVMGTHGRGGFERWVLGSVTEKVLRKSACPVLTVTERPRQEHPPAHAPFRRILCPLDFSDASHAALRWALSLAQEAQAHLTLLHVIEVPPGLAFPELATPAGEPLDLEQRVVARLREAVPEEARDWCETEERVLRGKPWTAIGDCAREIGADLIVVGVHGRGAIDLMVFGSTTHHVIREGLCPVLTIRQS